MYTVSFYGKDNEPVDVQVSTLQEVNTIVESGANVSIVHGSDWADACSGKWVTDPIK